MRLLFALEITFGLLLAYAVVTQLAIPLIRGAALFPFFRKQQKLENELAKARQEVIETQLEKEVVRTRSRTRKTQEGEGGHESI